jgi:hypothetical protein
MVFENNLCTTLIVSFFFFLGKTGQETLLIEWCEEIVDAYAIEVKKDSKAFQNGLAFCAIIHYYRPDLMYVETDEQKNKYVYILFI